MASTTTRTKTTTTPERPRGAARRTALLQATLALVGELGADAVTHRAVAQRAGLPLASTTYWFDSKEQLLTEALRHAADQDVARLDAAVAATLDRFPDGATAVDAIVAVAAGEGDGSDRGLLIAAYTLLLEAARRPALQAIAERWSAAYLDAYAELLRRAGSDSPDDDARLLMAATDGLLVDRLATGRVTGADPSPQLRRLIGALLPGAPR